MHLVYLTPYPAVLSQKFPNRTVQSLGKDPERVHLATGAFSMLI